MKTKIFHSFIFALSALLPLPFSLFTIGLIGDHSFTSGLKMLIRHSEMIVPYIIIPSVVSFISALVLVNHIKYKPDIKNNNRKSWVITSLLIVIMSLFIWAIVMVFNFQNHEKWAGFQLALYAGTFYSWALYPFGLLAGYLVWRLKAKSVIK